MNKVQIKLNPPEALWRRGEATISEEEGVVYVARFCRESAATKKPIHIGPTMSIVVLNDKNQKVSEQTATFVIRGDGEVSVRMYEDMPAELEKGAPEPKSKAEPAAAGK